MIDKWFIDDINKAAAGEGRVVVTDVWEEGKFLLNFLPSQLYARHEHCLTGESPE